MQGLLVLLIFVLSQKVIASFSPSEIECLAWEQCRDSADTALLVLDDDSEKWDPLVEFAYEICIDALPTDVGRKKLTLCNKALGLNEAISLCIFSWTKEYRSRKQVSSHKQVLKNKKSLLIKEISC